ncbi:dynamin family protein [Actinomycetospora straminea]|uniref:50S ribosome-binding GTPase n=1 Tax=Actinomycetospora straminea TaxID=663607 RepID=A0ABP9EMN1_9PSEU|nr:dynamin family protein [Actinomycetospora straminea]MDD7933458.1 dynamin family protein [Actinomycetospora straminea]
MSTITTRTRAVLDRALAVYAGDPAAADVLRAHRERLDGPLRVALAGTLKAGKSTLLNALVGEQIAPTGTAECTRVVTTYRDAPSARIVVTHRDGTPPTDLPVVHRRGALVIDLADTPVERVRALRVDWPSASLRAVTLIDTPGADSTRPGVAGRARAFLGAADPTAPAEGSDVTTVLDAAPGDGADVVLHLVRHLHGADVAFAETVGERAVRGIGPAGTVAVLSRADEIGGGRLDALVTAQQVARRYRADPVLRGHCRTVVPVAGLLAETARTLRGSEFAAVRDLAAGAREDVEDLLLSADRFLDAPGLEHLDRRARRTLLDRFGLHGLRLATTLVRRGASDSAGLAAELVRRSGLDDLRAVVGSQLLAHGDVFRARAALGALERVLRAVPRPRQGGEDAAAGLAADVERVLTGAHEFVEQEALVTLPARAGDELAEARRLLGGDGPAPAARLGVAADVPAAEVRGLALDALTRWRRAVEDPRSDRARTDLARVVARSVEGILAGVAAEATAVR